VDGNDRLHSSGDEVGPDIESDLVGIILALVPDAAIVVDPTGTIVSANQRAFQLFRYEHDEVIGRPVEQLVPERARPGHAALRDGYVAHPRRRAMGAGVELAGRRSDGSEFPVDISLAPFRGFGSALVIAAIRDITEAQEAHELVLLAEDRERIARDLHDLVIQRLFAAGLTLQSLSNTVAEGRTRERLDEVIDDLDLTIRDIRTTIFTLSSWRPVGNASVRDALLDVGREAGHSLGFQPVIRFEGPIDTVVSQEVSVHLVAVAREALSNVARHAAADIVEIELRAGDELSLSVIDDGKGFDADVHESGLANLRARAEQLGGTFEVAGMVGGGTRLVWRVPIS